MFDPKSLESGIVTSDGRFAGMAFLLVDGQRRWISEGGWFEHVGLTYTGKYPVVPEAVMERFRPGPVLAAPRDPSSGKSTMFEVRNWLTADLKGVGIEFGALANPTPVPIECNTLYADYLSYEELASTTYFGQTPHDLLLPDFQASIESPHFAADDVFDYAIATHVIEHVPNPIKAIREMHRIVKDGGYIVLIVPDKEKTFDSRRALTPLENVVGDYENPSPERDLPHFVDFYTNTDAHEHAGEMDAVVLERVAAEKWKEAFPIHYHVWDYASFDKLMQYIRLNVVRFDVVKKSASVPDSCEFYYCLRVQKS